MIGIFFGIVGVIGLFFALNQRKSQKPPQAFCEYFVYLPGIKAPPQHMVFRKVASAASLRTGDALLLSDIRLHVAYVLRSKNPHLFGPDFFEDAESLTSDMVMSLAEAKSLVIIRFASQTSTDDRYLRVVPVMAEVFAELGKGALIWDSGSHTLYSRADLTQALTREGASDSAGFHVRVQWLDYPEPMAQTWGMKKKGLSELRTCSMESDERTLVERLVEEAVADVWKLGAEPDSTDAEYLGGHFKILYEPRKKEPQLTNIRLMRISAT